MATPEEMSRRREVGRVKAANEQRLMELPNVTGVFTGHKITDGVDTGEIAICVTVTEKKDVGARSRIPEEIDGVKTDVIEEVIVPKVTGTAIRLEDLEPLVDDGTYPTLQGGISIGPCRSIFMEPPEVEAPGNYVFVGTLGCIVRDNTTSEPMMLSNFHVMCVDDGWSAGDTMAQPSLVDGGACPADEIGTLSRAQLNADVDAAVALVTDRPTSCDIVDIGDIEGTATAAVGTAVRKRGRTTELTFGTVTATDYTTNVDYGDGLGVVTLTNQIRIVNDPARSAFFGQGGDSGSVVVDDDNNVVGLYFAGNEPGTVGVANQIAEVLSTLNVSICGGSKSFKEDQSKEYAKEYFKREAKEFAKEYVKEFTKEFQKEFIKDWKEYAYEKFEAYEGGMPWDWRWDPVVNPPGGRPPVGGGFRPPAGGWRGWAPYQAGLPHGVTPRGDTGAGCIDLRRVDTGGGTVIAHPFYITIFDYTGAPIPSQIVSWGSHTGLDAGWTTEIKIDGRCPTVQATLVHFSRPATMEAYNADGSFAGTASMTTTQDLAQTLTIEGTAITHVRIQSPQNETILLALCCCADASCLSFGEREPGAVKSPKEFKEVREKEPWKELKEVPKEQLPKEFKEDRKEFLPKEYKEPKEIWEGSLEPPGGGRHFIPPSLRPDLGHGALRHEAGGRRRTGRRMRRRG